jgi:hypothetical protein
MQQHTRNYFEAYGYDESSFIPCEVCYKQATDIHHIEPRSKFGFKTKAFQDHTDNLIALCRTCHDKAHDHRIAKTELMSIVRSRTVLALSIIPIALADSEIYKRQTRQ